jgi:hypothetical protein
MYTTLRVVPDEAVEHPCWEVDRVTAYLRAQALT